jgi:hypothetical protein
LWIESFSGKDRNAILNQIYQMMWNTAVFKVVNEARRIAPVDTKGQTEINGMLHRFMDRCFFDSQFLSIRRLTDTAYTLEDPKKGIFSLVALLSDMKANASLLSRENLFSAEGLEYDYEAIQQRELEYAVEQSKKGNSAYWIPAELGSHSVRLRHEQIDALCGVKADQRKPSDTIRAEVFDFLIKRLKDASEDVNLRVNKYIAHAATPESREYVKADEMSLTLGHLWDAHKVICQVANFVDVYMLSRANHSFLPVPQYDHLEHIDKPLVSTPGVEVLSNAWHEFHKETDSWGSWGMKDLQKEMTQTNE